jgi:hypothetical protein
VSREQQTSHRSHKDHTEKQSEYESDYNCGARSGRFGKGKYVRIVRHLVRLSPAEWEIR